MAGRFRGAPGGGDYSDRGSSYGAQPPPVPNIQQPQQGPGGRRPGSDGFDGGSEPRQNPFIPGMGFDPARPVVKERVITNTRVELPPDAYRLEVC